MAGDGPAVLPGPAHPDVQRLEPAGHVPLGVLGVVAPVVDPALAQEQVAALELARPDGAVGPGRLQSGGVGGRHILAGC